MSTKICKWTRETGIRKEFRDLTRRSHQVTTRNISNELSLRIRQLADVKVGEQNVEVIPDVDELAVRKRIDKMKKELGSTSDIMAMRKLDIDQKPPEVGLSEDTKLYQPDSSLFRVKSRKLYAHPLYVDFPPIKNVQVEMDEIKARKNYLDAVRNDFLNLEEIDVREVLNPFDKVVKGQRNQMREKEKIKKEKEKLDRKWDNMMQKDTLKAEQEQKEKLKKTQGNKCKMKNDLDQLCEEQRQKKERIREIGKRELQNMIASGSLHDRQKKEEESERRRQKVDWHKVQLDDLQHHHDNERVLRHREEVDRQRDFEFSVFKRAMGRKMRQHIKHKMEGKFNKKNLTKNSTEGDEN